MGRSAKTVAVTVLVAAVVELQMRRKPVEKSGLTPSALETATKGKPAVGGDGVLADGTVVWVALSVQTGELVG